MTRINYIQPYATDLNIGAEYNRACSLIPEDEWVCITDQDVMFLDPKTKAHIQEIVDSNPPFDLLGCMTNRVGLAHQCALGYCDEDSDMLNHKNMASWYWLEHGADIRKTHDIIAGFLMLFPKKVWNFCKFEENTAHFDERFCSAIRNAGGKIGIMKGIYVFHLYRWGSKNPRYEYRHLVK